MLTRDEQFTCVERARADVLRLARREGIPLHRIEFVIPFVPTDLGLGAWFFYETDDQLRRAEAAGWSAVLTAALTRALGSAGYAEEWLGEIGFTFDSHEHVVRDYEGSYFYRLR